MADATEQTTTRTAPNLMPGGRTRFGGVALNLSPFFDNEPPPPSLEPPADDLIPRAEAKKAFEARDKAKKELQSLLDSGRVITDDQVEKYKKLEEAAAKSEEDRKRKSGEWDSLRTQLAEKHANEIKERDSKLSTLSQRFKNTVVRAEFGAASDYFNGSDSSKTILDVDLGMAFLGKFVQVEDTDDEIGYRVVVKKPNGDIIIGDDGNPAPFASAIGELIKTLPNKDRILRGSGKTGSGSSGGSTHAAAAADVTELTKLAQQGDKAAIEKLRARRNASNALVMGSALTR